jgi:serine/threonine-protein kinase
MIGQTISHYKITEKLGEGGMGVVYKADDTKLDRTVALKFLAGHLLNDDEAKTRFLREAKAAAGLDHPNICTVYEIAEAEGRTFLSMAFIEGESLEARIERGPMPLKEAVDMGRQVAEGLEAAHEKGVVHRDIKPANVMVDAKGRATIMDFGLARLTEASRLTKADQTMGTVAYMSPEQALGMEADGRTDIWALGVVLYEMVAGGRPFKGEYDQALLYEIVHEQPEPLTSIRAGVPIELEVFVGKCLAKDRADRYGNAGEIAKDLRTLAEKLKSGKSAILRTVSPGADSPTTMAARPTGNLARTWLWPAVAAVFAIVAVALALIAFRAEPGPATTRLSIPLPPGQEITSSPAISGDGRIIAYAAQQGTDEPQLYLRHLDSFEGRPVAGSSGATQPFFSPDGKWVAFFAQGQLQKAEVAGGAPIRLAETAFPFGGTWSPDNTIIYTASLGSGLLRIPASGGTPEALTNPDGAAEGYAHVFPEVLPGGRSVLFTIWGQTEGSAVLSLDSGEREMVLPSAAGAPIFDSSGGSTGRLLVVDQAAGIRAAPFDAAHPARTSADTSILADVYYDVEDEVRGWLAVSNTGTAVYAPGNPAKSSLVWVDKEGTTESLAAGQGVYREVTLSPKGTKAAVRQAWDLWIHDLQRGTRSRLTPAHTTNSLPLWSSDGARIIFASNRGGDWDIYSQPADGSRPAEALLSRPYDQFPTAVLADGTVLYHEINPQTGYDLWALSPGSPSQEGTTSPLPVTPFNERDAEVSPGPEGGPRWVAYTSNESGRSEIYVQSYPSGANRMPVSTGGGILPRWSRDGKELFYVTGDAVVAVAIRADGSFGAPRRLFDRTNFYTSRFRSYEVSPDGKRFLMIQRDPGSVPRQLNVILNWSDGR